MAVHGYDAVALDHPKNRFGFVYPGNKVVPDCDQNSPTYKMSNKQHDMFANPNNDLSRLEQLRIGYQQRLLHEKEQKLSQLFQSETANRSRRNKSKSGGTVRQFFAERRALENTNYARKNPECLPPIQHHFEKVKQQRTNDHLDSSQKLYATVRPRGEVKSISAPPASVRKHTYQRAKPRAGIDRQNPLPSLKAGNKKEPVVFSHYETEASLIDTDQEETGQITFSPHPPVDSRKKNAAYVRPFNRQSPGFNNVDDVKLDVTADEVIPEKLSKVKMLRAKRLSQTGKANVPASSPSVVEERKKLTDFQKWQMEQDEERRQRLEEHRQRQDSENSDLSYSQQERELLEKIRAEKESLKEIQKEQKKLEEERRREKEEMEEWLNSQKELDRVAEQMERERERMEKEKEQMEKEKKQMEKERKKKELDKSRKAKPIKPKKPIVESPIIKTEMVYNTGEDEADASNIDPATEDYFKSFYEAQAAAAAAEDEVTVDFAECSVCGRKFAADRLAKHQNVCAKSTQKKRKVFDYKKMRMQGTDMEAYIGKKDLGEPAKPIRKSNWRAQHENFVQTIRYAKGVTDEAPAPAQNPDYIQCPHCDRKFNEAAAERHIPRCKDIKAKPATLKRKK